jgi:hypothetical protein
MIALSIVLAALVAAGFAARWQWRRSLERFRSQYPD